MAQKQNIIKHLAKCLITAGISVKQVNSASELVLEDARGTLQLRVSENKIIIGCNKFSLHTFLRYIGTKPNISNFPAKGSETDPAKINALCLLDDSICMQEAAELLDSRKISYTKDVKQNLFCIKQGTLQLAGYYGDWTYYNDKGIEVTISHYDLCNYF